MTSKANHEKRHMLPMSTCPLSDNTERRTQGDRRGQREHRSTVVGPESPSTNTTAVTGEPPVYRLWLCGQDAAALQPTQTADVSRKRLSLSVSSLYFWVSVISTRKWEPLWKSMFSSSEFDHLCTHIHIHIHVHLKQTNQYCYWLCFLWLNKITLYSFGVENAQNLMCCGL